MNTYACVYVRYIIYCTMFRVLDHFWSPIVPCYTTEDAVWTVNSFITISHLHVATITHNYFSRCATFTQLTILHICNYDHILHSYTFTLADFSAINYCLKLSHTLHLHTLKLPLRSYSTNSLLKTPLEYCLLKTAPYKLN
jgi:hypothetical protein